MMTAVKSQEGSATTAPEALVWVSGDLWKDKKVKQWVGGEHNLPGDLCRGARFSGAFRTWKKCESQRLQSWLQASIVTCNLSRGGLLSGHPLYHRPPCLLSPGGPSG